METEEIQRKLTKLENDREKDRSKIAVLQKQISGMERTITSLNETIKESISEVTGLRTMSARFEQLDVGLASLRKDVNRTIANIEKHRNSRDQEFEKMRLNDLESMNKTLSEYRKGAKNIQEVNKILKEWSDKEYRMEHTVEDMQKAINSTLNLDDEYRQNQKLVQETQRQDTKRLTDIQGEVAALRKRSDEHRTRIDLSLETIKRVESRLNEFQSSEIDRRQSFTMLIEKQNLLQVERDRIWREWQTRFESVDSDAKSFEIKLKSLDETLRTLKRLQTTFEEMNQRLDRRMNELSEMQRITEERSRQDWLNFKAEDQKRWANYSLGQDEIQREITQEYEKTRERLIALEDLTQELKENFVGSAEINKKHLQGILEFVNQWLESNERNTGRIM
jgi:chromosome segregation ATPase